MNATATIDTIETPATVEMIEALNRAIMLEGFAREAGDLREAAMHGRRVREITYALAHSS